ncbi:unnamed protein product [Calypogeia fissa]
MARTTTISGAAFTALVLGCAMIFLGGAAAAEKVYSQTFKSPAFILGPGDVCNKELLMEMPKGHIALRSFNAQVVDEDGVPVPLHQTYLHHWTAHRYYMPRSTSGLRDPVLASNWGVCEDGNLKQLYGLGSETRRTDTNIPAPYGIEVGDPDSIPVGYDEVWILNVHAIDTRGTVDKRKCTECVCELYNITHDTPGKHGEPIPEDYEGGLECCFDETHCALQEGFEGPKRTLYMEYFVKWVEMSEEVVPVKVYIFDVTDKKTTANGKDKCAVEYTVPKCGNEENACVHKEENINFLPTGGDVIYAVAHQHAGGLGSTLYKSDGSVICSSLPTYGNGIAAGDEEGYIVGMSTCVPTPGQVKVKAGEALKVTSWYNSEDRHTGVMGLYYILVDDSAEVQPPEDNNKYYGLMAAAFVAAVILIAAIIANHLKAMKRGPEYESLRTAAAV